MKKCIFTLLFCLLIAVAGVNEIYAQDLHHVIYGVKISSYYTMEISSSGKYVYKFNFVLQSDDPTSYGASLMQSRLYYGTYDTNGEFVVDKFIASTDEGDITCYESSFGGDPYVTKTVWTFDYESEELLFDYTGTMEFVMRAYFQSKGSSTVRDEYVSFTLDGEVPDPNQTPSPTPTSTPVPTPTSAPKPTPTSTPEPTPVPTSTPLPTPTNTPTPTPTNTPTPTPTPGPVLELNAYVDGNTAVADYYTGGCTPVKSSIEFYEVDTASDTLLKLNSEIFVSGAGTMKNSMEPGKVYRYKLHYVYQRDGLQYQKWIWSEDLSVVDQELEDYKNNKKITNFRTAMLVYWDEFMELVIPVEGFNVKLKDLFIWSLIASAAIFFFKKWNGG